jgi:hypothetical protein
MGWDWGLNVMPLGPRLHKHRMFLRQFLHRNAMKRNHNILTLETHQLAAGLLNSPDNYLYHVRRYSSHHSIIETFYELSGRATAAIIMKIAYGYDGILSLDQMLSRSHISFSWFVR